MKSKTLSSKEISWDSPLHALSNRKNKTIEKLFGLGYQKVKDLLWIVPLRTQVLPTINSFATAQDNGLFQGVAKILNFQHRPSFKGRGKGNAPLANVSLVVQDRFSKGTMSLKWFNCYPSIVSSLRELNYLAFSGPVSSYMNSLQIISPQYHEISEQEFSQELDLWQKDQKRMIKVAYPTIQGISPVNLQKVFNRIPETLWDNIEETVPKVFLERGNHIDLQEAFRRLHGKCPIEAMNQKFMEKAKNRLIYEEFMLEQVQLLSRKDNLKQKNGLVLDTPSWSKFLSYFPYELTDDQKLSLDSVEKDLKSGAPMMRLVQGDVGSGKTTVALIACLMSIEAGHQAVIMCPTESLALQHFLTVKETLGQDYQVECLTGSLTKKEKDLISSELENGRIQLIIGTHALIQDSIHFSSLGLAIIDEQHKFGVAQRMKLVNKGTGTHCLLMSATPIPRSLSLTQYGDLEISTIKTMPLGRKGTQTRIVSPETYQKYLSFIKTRVSMGEQAYVVVPAIEESEEQDILNLEVTLKQYHQYFPELSIKGLHGKMKSEEKNNTFVQFREEKIDILISTSVIEVGINNPNATIMAIHNPERFGLSSLHQMRGRVGRGDKPGFCFLVNDKRISASSMERLKVIEKNTDGFIIAEEDLRLRGEGDLFGKEQSGVKSSKIFASLIEHQDVLLQSRQDLEEIINEHPNTFKKMIETAAKNEIVTSTI